MLFILCSLNLNLFINLLRFLFKDLEVFVNFRRGLERLADVFSIASISLYYLYIVVAAIDKDLRIGFLFKIGDKLLAPLLHFFDGMKHEKIFAVFSIFYLIGIAIIWVKLWRLIAYAFSWVIEGFRKEAF